MPYHRLLTVVIVMILISVNAIPQSVSEIVTSTSPDTINPSEDIQSSHSFYSGIGFGSNMIYLGSTISQDNPYGYTSLTYGFKDQFFLTASAIHLSKFSPFLALYNFSVNYSHVINSWFDFSMGIYRYQATQPLEDTLFNSFTYGDAVLGIDWRLLYTRISYSGILARDGGSYLQIRNSRYFETPEFFHKKMFVSFDPYVNLLFGPLITSETTNGTVITVTNPKRPWGGTTTHSSSTTTYTKKFGIMEVDFGLPVTLNSDVVTIEAETGYVLPIYTDPEYPGIKGFVFLLSAYFRIF